MARHGYRWRDGPRRSSRRLDGWAPGGDPERASTKPFFLPYELLTDIISRLDKKALKAVRLTCKDWKQVATPFLFDRIWVSPRTKDMSVFTSLTETPDLAVHIKEVRYDQLEFTALEDLHEFMELVVLKNDCLVHGLPRAQSHPGFSIGQCASAVYRLETQPLEEAVDQFNLRGFMKEGYKAWRRMVADEASLLNSYSYFEQLMDGFALLPNLCSLVLDEEMWCNHMDEFSSVSEKQSLVCDFSGSPFARSWHPFYLRPLHPMGVECDGQGFKILMHALANAGKRIENFDGSGNERLGLTFRSSWLRPSFARSLSSSVQAVLSQLRSLSLKVQMQKDDDLKAPSTLGYLPLVLRQARLLSRLRLDFRACVGTRVSPGPAGLVLKRIKFEHIFGYDIKYPFLRHLALSGVILDTWNLQIFLSQCCKRIKWLGLRNINVLSGSWAAMVQSLRFVQETQLVNLDTCRLSSIGAFEHRDGQLLRVRGQGQSHDELYNEAMRDDRLNSYILYGGRHPYLSEGDLQGQEWEWWLDSLPKEVQVHVQPLLRQCLREYREESRSKLHNPSG
ncbi:MAG: hypothetical protein OHK93_008023 [Ramalina farinacea]|uniref:F-box domain-containing protein n=1 Tax=Ramalina farinacea TaxID=258253 RepID=A0AA43TY61_9LECA|nr:hypothetical protein [Ramalina farinacea]